MRLAATDPWPSRRPFRWTVERSFLQSQYEFLSDCCLFHRATERGGSFGGNCLRIHRRPSVGDGQSPAPGHSGLLAGLTSTQVAGGSLVLAGIGRLAQDEVEPRTELAQ